tara:strand:+ start:843 stop:1367 length:525 start_codon:yes stop_codon:yes gene_type:complete
MAAYENLDNVMAQNLMGRSKTLFPSKKPTPFREMYPKMLDRQYEPPPKPFTKTRPSIKQPSMVNRSLQDYMRAVYGVPGKQQPRIPGMLGPASLLAALAPAIRDRIMGSMGLNPEGLENETWFNPEGSSHYIDPEGSSYYRGEPSRLGKSPHPLPSNNFNEEDFLRDTFRTTEL